MIKIIESKMVYQMTYSHVFTWKSDPGSGFTFPCDTDGVLSQYLCSAALENYAKCRGMNKSRLDDWGVVGKPHSYKAPALGLCACGKTIELSGFTNACECGRDYNRSGQELATRALWGEETGEERSDEV